jgi:nitric oxide reductase subunit B
MDTPGSDATPLSHLWKQAVLLVMILGFSLLTLVTVKTYAGAPPIPGRVVDAGGNLLFTGDAIRGGQDVFFKYALMEHGTLWGHGAYLGPDYSAEYLHRLAETGRDTLARRTYGAAYRDLPQGRALEIAETLKLQLKENRYRPGDGTLVFLEPEAESLRVQEGEW